MGDVIYRLRHMSGRVTVPPMIKLGLLVALGLVPFLVFALLQSDGDLTGDSDQPSQPISNQRIPLAFPFGTPEAPSTAPVSESTTTTTPASAPAAAQCADGKDNDLDGRVDLRDTGCSSRQDNNEAQAATTTRRPGSVTTTVPPLPTTPPPIPTTAPPTTTSPPPPPPPPPSTAPPPTRPPSTALRVQGECSDGKDNDGDGKTDLEDRASCHGDPTQDE